MGLTGLMIFMNSMWIIIPGKKYFAQALVNHQLQDILTLLLFMKTQCMYLEDTTDHTDQISLDLTSSQTLGRKYKKIKVTLDQIARLVAQLEEHHQYGPKLDTEQAQVFTKT